MTICSRALAVFGLATLVMSGGCASIVSGRHADVQLESYPSNAHVVVQDKRGREVASITTPGVVSLKRTDRYFWPARYTATFAAPGYEPVAVPIRSTVNPWILGNVVVGGIPGLVVDSATGATWKPKEEAICQHLEPLTAATPLAYQPGTGVYAGAPPVGTAPVMLTAAPPIALPAAPPAVAPTTSPASPAAYMAQNPASGVVEAPPRAY